MSKVHFDRLRQRYGYTGENLKSLMEPVIANNIEGIGKKIAKLDNGHWQKSNAKIKDREKRFILPSMKEVLPKRSVFILKAAQDGEVIFDTLRDRLTKNLRDTLNTFTEVTKEPTFIRRRGIKAGQMNPKLIEQFRKSITTTFVKYTRKDPRYNVPSNIRNIAITEMRDVNEEMKRQYTEKLLDKNPDAKVRKRWIHNARLSRISRRGHAMKDNISKTMNAKFSVPLFKILKTKGRRRWVKVRTDEMSGPYDRSVPLDQIIGCIPGDIKIYADGIKAITRRYYIGQLFKVQTRAGLEISVTPNHPILTQQGWISANSLKVGMNIVGVQNRKVFDRINMNINNRPIMISEIFDFFSIIFKLMRKKGSNADFHGDGKDGEIDIIFIDSELINWFNPKIIKHFLKFVLSFSNILQILLSHLCTMNERQDRHLPIRLPMFISFFSHFFPLAKTKLICSIKSCFRYGSYMNILFKKSMFNSASVNTEDICKLKNRCSEIIAFDDIVHIQRYSYSGHVYNLHTNNNIYFANQLYNDCENNTMILHNCSCELEYLFKKG